MRCADTGVFFVVVWFVFVQTNGTNGAKIINISKPRRHLLPSSLSLLSLSSCMVYVYYAFMLCQIADRCCSLLLLLVMFPPRRCRVESIFAHNPVVVVVVWVCTTCDVRKIPHSAALCARLCFWLYNPGADV